MFQRDAHRRTDINLSVLCACCLQFGSSSQAVFFKMRVAGVLHIFQFETRQGEDICMALQTHINDIMMKRYSKVICACVCGLECVCGLGGLP
jgi:hypothetical protein